MNIKEIINELKEASFFAPNYIQQFEFIEEFPLSLKNIRFPIKEVISYAFDRGFHYFPNIEIEQDKLTNEEIELLNDVNLYENFSDVNRSDLFLMAAIEKTKGKIINKITAPTNEMLDRAVELDGENIKYIKNPTEVQKLKSLLSSYGLNFFLIPKPSEDLKLLAVTLCGNNIEYINNPTEEMVLTALNSYGWAIKYIDNPSYEQLKQAVILNGDVLEIIENPSEELCMLAIQFIHKLLNL